jgi:phospholipase C
MSNGKQVGLLSAKFPNVYLRLDGRGVTQPIPNGGGVVNAQYTKGPWEVFVLEEQDDGMLAIASVQFPGVYLRLDGTGVTQKMPNGGGIVNAQFGIGETERFQGEPQDDGTMAFLSAKFPLVYLRLDGTGVTQPNPNGAGVVNAQYTAFDKEFFRVV